MKRSITIIFFGLFTPFFCASQKLNLIFSLKWNINKDLAIKIVKKSKGVLPSANTGDTTFGTLQYDDQYFDDHKSYFTILYFTENKLDFIEVHFLSSDKNMPSRLYDSIKNILTQKYFQPQQCGEEKMKFFCYWYFPLNDPEAKNGLLSLSAYNDKVVVIYKQHVWRDVKSDF